MKKIKLTRVGKKNFPIYKVSLSVNKRYISSFNDKNYGIYIPKQKIISVSCKSILQSIKLGATPSKSLIRISLKYIKTILNNNIKGEMAE